MSTLQIARLIFVEGRDGANNNKFYDMFEQGDGNFRAEYGRVDKTKTTKIYPMSKWTSTLRGKIKKGYEDKTHLFSVSDKKENKNLFNISNSSVKNLITSLDSYSKKSVQQNYKISSDKVTIAMINEAQGIIDNLVKSIKVGGNKETINSKLLDLYKVIPRVMNNVSNYLLDEDITKDNLEQAEKLISTEQATLDVMRGQVNVNTAQEDTDKESVDILNIMGIDVEPANDDATVKLIKQKMGPQASKFRSAFRIKNSKTHDKFDKFLKTKSNQKTELFWHGSRNENWLSIMEGGLVLRPANAVVTGKMFGWGTYFADKFQKSLNYTSYRGSYYARGNADRAYLALFKVHVGNQHHVTKWQNIHSSLTEAKLKAIGDYDSVFAHGGVDLINNEFIVYNEAQTTIEYLVEVQ